MTKPCLHCGDSTPWGYPERSFELETRTYQAAVSEATDGVQKLVAERRKSQRKAAQLPVRIRDYYGEVEVACTENISQDGFYFSSPRRYLIGQGVVVICPFDANNEKAEVRARIVRLEDQSDKEKHLYGVRYETSSHPSTDEGQRV